MENENEYDARMMSLGRITLSEKDIAHAKALNKEFQEVKNSDKAIAGKASKKQKGMNAWIGALEVFVARLLAFHNISFTQEPYVKTDSSRPDYVIDGMTTDVKITRGSRGMFMQPVCWGKPNIKWDLYMGFRTSWSGTGREEEKNLEAIFARGEKPYIELIGFTTNGFIKNTVARESEPLADLLKVSRPWKTMPKVYWNKNKVISAVCGMEKNAPECTYIDTKFGTDKRTETWVFPPRLLFQYSLLVEALTRKDAAGTARFENVLVNRGA